jgi:menaquinone-dependent protoporphyrinogen IX oxidase
MWLTGGPTQRDAVVEFTDWRRVEQFGNRLAAAVRAAPA